LLLNGFHNINGLADKADLGVKQGLIISHQSERICKSAGFLDLIDRGEAENLSSFGDPGSLFFVISVGYVGYVVALWLWVICHADLR
jgi:hypothetical protein